MSESLTPTGMPFPCPNCGAVDQWKADYYEAVYQGVTVLANEAGEPEVFDYAGDTSTYDDGGTDNEAIVCLECGHSIVFARFVLVPPIDLAELRESCGYPDEPAEDADGILEDVPVDALIAYKDALEDLVAKLVPAEKPA